MIGIVLFWLAVAALAWAYVGYPLLALGWGRVHPARLSSRTGWPNLVTVGLAVYDGAAQIDDRIANVLAQKTPFPIELIVASDGSSDETARLAAGWAERDERVRLLVLARGGQSAAQAAIFEAARGEVVVLSDLETRFEPDCLAELVAPLSDPSVGCTTGVLNWRYDEATPVAQHEGLYWRYEQTIRHWENRAGWLSSATGALMAVRRSLYQPVPAHASLDQMLPLLTRAAGLRVVRTDSAVATDRGMASLGEQLDTRTRIATQGIEANLRMAPRLPITAFASTVSRKLLRWLTPFLGLVALVAGLIAYVTDAGSIYLVPVFAGAAMAGLSLVGLAAERLGRPIPVASFALTITAVNAAFAVGWLNVLVGRPIAAWESVVSTTPPESAEERLRPAA